MQIILLENIMKLGKIGDQVEVKNGFGRNYLLRQGKALRASKENIEFVNKKKTELNKKNEDSKKQFMEISAKIINKTLQNDIIKKVDFIKVCKGSWVKSGKNVSDICFLKMH